MGFCRHAPSKQCKAQRKPKSDKVYFDPYLTYKDQPITGSGTVALEKCTYQLVQRNARPATCLFVDKRHSGSNEQHITCPTSYVNLELNNV